MIKRFCFKTSLKLAFLLFVLFGSNQLMAQGKVSISGQTTPLSQEPMQLQFLSSSFQNDLDQAQLLPDETGKFKISLPIMEDQVMNLFVGSEIIRFHAAPGDSLFLTLTKKDGKTICKFSGKGALEAAWPDKQKEYFQYNLESPQYSQTLLSEMGTRTPEQFKQYIDSITQVKTDYLQKNAKGLQPAFVHWQKTEIQYENESLKLNYPVWFYSMRGIENKVLNVDSSYYAYLNKINLNDPKNLGSSQYRNFLKYMFMFEIRKSGKQFSAPDLYRFCALFYAGQTLKTFRLHLWSDIMQFGNISDATAMYPEVKAELSNEPGFAWLDAKYKEKLPFAVGAEAIPFTLRSIDGKQVSLSDYKGKVVFIDFWASWCGPCKREIPAGEELKKYFAGKDVVFLNISIDEDEDKWRNAVQNLTFSGTHLICNSQNNPRILDAYHISTIPAYYLIGKDGKFIAAPAARPSQPEIYPLIENALK